MAVPSTAPTFPQSLDPQEKLGFKVDVSSQLEVGETIASYTVVATAEAQLLGLTIGTGGYAVARTGNVITFWLSSTVPSDPAFVNGVVLPIEITLVTDSSPARTKQRTVGVLVVQQ